MKELVETLRELSGGVPIGAKMGAGGKIEEDIDHLIDIGVDYIAVDGDKQLHSAPHLFYLTTLESQLCMRLSGLPII